ncbi:MAG: hypothetical protein ABS901_01675, partial [Candidatus Limivicinus sp.]
LQLIFMGVTMLFLIVGAILLPGYAAGTRSSTLIFAATILCVASFAAALVVRIRFGRERKRLSRGSGAAYEQYRRATRPAVGGRHPTLAAYGAAAPEAV